MISLVNNSYMVYGWGMKRPLFITLSSLATCFGSIDLIEIAWDASLCGDSCVKKLEGDFKKLREVASITMNGSQGRAQIQWKKEAPFSFTPLNWTLRATGVRQKFIRLQVTGEISERKGSFFLRSSGDTTEFILLGPLQINPNQAAARHNPSTQILTEEMKATLRQLIANKEVATISGEYFEPFRAPPNYIVVEKISSSSDSK